MVIRKWSRIMVLVAMLTSVWNLPRTTRAGELQPHGLDVPVGQKVAPLSLQPKQLSGPANEIDAMSLPDPQAVGTRSQYVLNNVQFSNGSWSGVLNIEQTGKLSVMVVARDNAAWNIQITLPNGQQSSLGQLSEQSGGTRQVTTLGMEDVTYPADVYMIYNPQPGLWQVTVQAQQTDVGGFLIATPESPYGLYSYFNTVNLIEGQPINFGAYLYTEPLPSQPMPQESPDQLSTPPSSPHAIPQPLTEVVLKGEVTVHDPTGQQKVLAIKDDGSQDDGFALDGAAGAVLVAAGPGLYHAQVRLTGTLSDGTVIERTSEQTFPVLPASFSLTGWGAGWMIDDYRIGLTIEAQVHGALPTEVVTYAEVWSTDSFGSLIPVGWSSSVAFPGGQPGEMFSMQLEFDTRWLALVGANGYVELRNVRVQDSATHVPITTAASISIGYLELPQTASMDRTSIDPNDPELRMGRPPVSQPTSSAVRSMARHHSKLSGMDLTSPSAAAPVAPVRQTQLVSPRSFLGSAKGAGRAGVSAPLQQVSTQGILLVHGYCSGAVWPEAHFDDGATVEFFDVGQNRTHNEFARLIAQQGNQAFSQSFTIVAHSQGGAAALELYSRYWSGLDFTQAPRRIQTVGTPYWGTPLAGVLAWIGQVFNASCGANWNLTPLGSALWQATIPAWARDDVYYATTTHGNWWIFESICHASSLILSGIDDGLVSNSAGQLPGGHDLGMKRDWCHSSRMLYDPQYMDLSRNSEMDIYGRVSSDVGIIPATESCPNGQGILTIHMDDEDNNNANSRSGWIGATTSTNNTTFRFCRVPGGLFRALSTTNLVQNHYAVLKLGTICPNGSVEFTRHFDNEDRNNKNSSSGGIAPNVSDSNTTLVFCLFRSSGSTMSSFPNLGISYGVFATSTFSQALRTGYAYTDDEDRNNKNSFSANPGWVGDAQRIITGGSNTSVNMVQVR